MIARVTLPSGRVVIDTGKVRIGLLAAPPRQPEAGSHALLIQTLLTTVVPREWHQTPRVIRLRRSWWQRLRDWWMEGKRELK